MRTIIKLLAVFALVLVTFGQHTTASAAYAENIKYRGADASFESFDPSGCIRTRVYISAVDDRSEVYLSIIKYNICTDTRLLQVAGYAPLGDSDFRLSGNLNSATLNSTFTVYDWISDSFFDVSVGLTWTGIGPLSRYNNNIQSHGPISGGYASCHDISNSVDSWRDAQVTGTVSTGEMNFTPEPSVLGTFFSVKNLYVSGCHALMLATLNPEIAAATGGMENFKYSGTYSEFYQIDPSGCIVTGATVWAADIVQGPGSGNKLSGAALRMIKYDTCASKYLLYAYNYNLPLADSDFRISGNSASLDKTVTVYDDISDSFFDVWIDLAWTASGPLNQNVYILQWRSPDCQPDVHENWGWRLAKASGTISSAKANFAPALSDYAEFDWDRYVVDQCD